MSGTENEVPGEFASATAVNQIDETAWEGEFSADWLIGQTLNGGYAMSIGARVLSRALPHADPIASDGFFLARTEVGKVRCEVEVLRVGKGTSTATVKMIQRDELKIQMTATYADLDRQRGVTLSREALPDIPRMDRCVDAPFRENQPFRDRLLQKMTPANVRALEGELDGSGVWHAWMDFADGSYKDVCSLIMFADALPPPLFSIYGAEGWVPTLDLSVQIHGKPTPGPLRCVFRTNVITRGIVNEEGLLWDSTGDIVAVARQTAKYRQP